MLKAVIFDLDGTLLDTIEDLADSMNAVLEGRGAPPHPVDAYKVFVGDGVETLVRRALPEALRTGESIRDGVVAMRAEYANRWNAKTRPYDGVPEMLDGLAERGVPMAILSNKPDGPTREVVAEFLSDWSFTEVRGARDGVPPKPDPQAALDIAENLGLPPAAIHYLGDTNTDMRTAVSAGMIPVGALWGFRDEPELSASGARFLIARPEELLDVEE